MTCSAAQEYLEMSFSNQISIVIAGKDASFIGPPVPEITAVPAVALQITMTTALLPLQKDDKKVLTQSINGIDNPSDFLKRNEGRAELNGFGLRFKPN